MAKSKGDQAAQAAKAAELQEQADMLAAQAEALRVASREAEAAAGADPPRRRRTSKGPAEPGVPDAGAAEMAPATKKRCNGKSDVEKVVEKMAKSQKPRPSLTEQVARLVQTCDFCLTWENLPKLVKHFGISEREATTVLAELVGPNPVAKRFWDGYRREVKAEPLEDDAAEKDQEPFEFTEQELKEAVGDADLEQKAKRRRLRPLFECDKADQCDDEPDEWMEQTESEHEEDAEADDAEAEAPDGDENAIMADTQPPPDDDHDSGSGGSMVGGELPEQVCEKVGPDGEPPRPAPEMPPPKINRTASLTPSEFRSMLCLVDRCPLHCFIYVPSGFLWR